MALKFFKPNKNIKGALASFSFNSKDQALYLQIVRQTGYNEQKHIGSFKDGQRLNLKFHAAEIAGLLRSIRELVDAKFYHQFNDNKTSIFFSPYKGKEEGAQIVGFGLTVNQETGGAKEVYRIPFTLDEGYLIEEYLKFVLTHFFNASYADDKKRAEEYAKKSKSNPEPDAAPKSNDAELETETTVEDEDLF